MLLHIEGKDLYGDKIAQFKYEYGISRILGISGGSENTLHMIPKNDPLQIEYAHYIETIQPRVLYDLLEPLRGYQIAILTGGTEGGVPEMATTIAKKLGFKTIGVFPERGEKYALNNGLLDLAIAVHPLIPPSQWGDEGVVWTNLVNGVFVIGGGAGTLTEAAHIQKLNAALIKDGKTPKFIIPLHGTNGIADLLPHIWADPTVRDLSMPSGRIYTGAEAARMFIDKLSLDECIDFDYQTTSGEVK